MQQSKWDKGIVFIQKGCDKHEAGDKATAARLYERGIQFCLDHVKAMPTSNRKFEKQQQINTYLQLVEDLRPDKHTSSQRRHLGTKQNKSRLIRRHSKSNPNPNPNPKKKARSKHDQEMYQRIEDEILSDGLKVSFSDVVGLENVKQALLEAVILPARRPEIFVGPRAPPKGLLLFGPPGNGKTFIAKARALSSLPHSKTVYSDHVN